MNDFNTLQQHIESLVNRPQSRAPDQESYYLDGYVVLRQCEADSRAILATHYNPGIVGLDTGGVPETEVQKATLQRYNHYVTSRSMAELMTGSYWMHPLADFKLTKSI